VVSVTIPTADVVALIGVLVVEVVITNLPASSIVHQPTTLPRASEGKFIS
jgi:hypothetical protein